MTVIRPNSITGITSITAQANEINVFRSNGLIAGLNLNGVNFNTTAGISTLAALKVTGNVDVAGVLTYQDVTNVDSLGIGTFRTGINVSGGQLDVGSNIKLGNAGVITATSFVGSGANLTGIAADKIFEGNTEAEVVDTGSDGHFKVTTEGSERLRIASDGATKVCHNGGAFGVGGDPINKFGITASDNNFFGLHRSNASTGTGEFNINVEVNSQVTFSMDDEGAFSFGTSTDPSAQSGYSEKLRIASNGKITSSYQIVNDTAPDFSFEITQVDPSNTVNQLGGSGVGLVFKPATNSTGAVGAGIAAIKPGGSDGDTTSDLAFYVSQNDETLDEALRILSNSQLLHTRTDNTTRYDLEFRNTGGIGDGNYGGIEWTQGSSGGTSLAAMKIAYQNSGQPDIVFYTRQGGGTSSSESVRFTHEGYVQTPKNPYFRAYHNGNADMNGVVIWNSTQNNNGNVYDTSTGVFTAPIAGFYWFAFTVKGRAVGNTVYARAEKSTNGGSSYSGIGPALEFHNDILSAHTTASFGEYLNASDKVRIGSGSNVRIDGSNGFSGFLAG